MLLNWASGIDYYTILCAVVSGISAFVASLIALGEVAGRYKYALLLPNTAVAISFGLASNFLYKFGGGFDRPDTKMAFGVYGATAFTAFLLLPVLKTKKTKAITANAAVLAGLSVVTTAAFFNIDDTSAYLTIPFTVWAILCAVFSRFRFRAWNRFGTGTVEPLEKMKPGKHCLCAAIPLKVEAITPGMTISVSNDVLFNAFAFCRPFMLGLNVALASDRFNLLVQSTYKTKQMSLGQLFIRRAIDRNGAEIVKTDDGDERRLRIPQEPLPGNVTGFERLVIRYVDRDVIAFLQRIRRLFDSNEVHLYMEIDNDQNRSWQIIWHRIWPLINDNICGISLRSTELDRLRRFSPTILGDCTKLRWIETFGRLPEFPADDSAGASSSQALAKWLHTPRGDGRPKVLECGFCFSTEMEGIKNEFLASVVAQNNLTRERLSLLSLQHVDENKWMLIRCPIWQEGTDKWAKHGHRRRTTRGMLFWPDFWD
uniref:Uncharacterized protein n=1 Tax=Globodera rostochiensis TaxID=31243 RepID=A0A914HKG9_GLORO